MPSSKSLSELTNLGPRSQEWLNAIGIYTMSDLEEIGPIEAYRQLRELDYPATLNLVYGIQGVLIRESLRSQVSELDVNSKR